MVLFIPNCNGGFLTVNLYEIPNFISVKKAKKGPDDDVEAIMEQYFTQVKPSYEQTLQWKDHAHFFAEPDMSEGEFSLH